VKLQKETVLSLVKGSTVFINYLGEFISLLFGLSFILLLMMVFCYLLQLQRTLLFHPRPRKPRVADAFPFFSPL
jgi:hypothetical protein